MAGSTALEQLGIGSWSRGRDWRSTGLYGQFVTYAEVLQLIIALTLGLFVSLPIKRSWPAVLLLIALAGFGGALLLTVTRASWLGCLVASLIILLLAIRRRTLIIIFVLAVPLILAGLFILQQKRNVAFIDQTDQSTTWRETVWREGFSLLVSKPRHLLVGIGMDSIKGHWREWGMFDHGRIPPGPHALKPLTNCARTGRACLDPLAGVLVCLCTNALALVARRNRAPLDRAWDLIGVIGGINRILDCPAWSITTGAILKL